MPPLRARPVLDRRSHQWDKVVAIDAGKLDQPLCQASDRDHSARANRRRGMIEWAKRIVDLEWAHPEHLHELETGGSRPRRRRADRTTGAREARGLLGNR